MLKQSVSTHAKTRRCGEAGQIRDRHLAITCGGGRLNRNCQLAAANWIRWLEEEMDNIRAALERSTDGDAEENLQVVESRRTWG